MSVQLLEDLFVAYYDARRNKRNTGNQLKFEINLEDNLLKLYRELEDRSYVPGKSVAFIIENPVKREVFAASFEDRVIHHLYFNYVNRIFEKTFIDDCYSCRKGRGTSYGIKRLDHHIRSCSQNFTIECYVLKLDLSGYFMSIDRKLLYQKIIHALRKYADRKDVNGIPFKHLLDYELIYFLTRVIVYQDPTLNCLIKGEKKDWIGLPPDKSLFFSTPGCGLPIGNLTSQLFSNIFLTDFDHYVKRKLHLKHYGRYVDDFYVIHNSKTHLVGLLDQIRKYLKEELQIKLHPRKIYLQNVCRGVPFLGAVIKPHRLYLQQRTIRNFQIALSKGAQFYQKSPQGLVSTVNSYFGISRHYRSFHKRSTIMQKNKWIFKFGWVDINYRRFRFEIESLPAL